MAATSEKITAVASTVLRVASYIFLRWIPSPVAARVAYTFFALYIPSFLVDFLTQAQYLIEDKIKVTIVDKEVPDTIPADLDGDAQLRRSSRSKKDHGATHIEEEVTVDETVVIEEQPKHPWRTLLSGIPSPTSALLSAAALLVNVGLILAVTDLTHRAKLLHPSHDLSFARLGYLSTSEANLLVREPDVSQWPVFVSYRAADTAASGSAWRHGATIASLSNDTDFTVAVKLLLPDKAETTYQWQTSNNHTGSFTTPPHVGHVTAGGTFTFLTTSCILPNFPYNPFNHGLSMPGFKHLAKVLQALPGGAQFMLFVGDFIYVDVPQRFGVTADNYRREYRQIYASPDWPRVGQNLSWLHVLDDHEIANDWDQGTTGIYKDAVDPWHIYHASVNPPRARQATRRSHERKNATYFSFVQGPAAFFMMDTRTYRDPSAETAPDAHNKTMLGAVQLADLRAFLQKSEPRGVKWKFVISSIPFTKNWRVNGVDTWGGYLHERQIILESMWDAGMQGIGVVVLSGDRHEFAATAFPPPLDGKWPISATVNEHSVGPLSQFYLPVPTYKQTDNEDVEIKYIPRGNSKVGAITIEDAASDQSSLKFKLFVDGDEVWSNILLSPPLGHGKRARDALWG